MSSITAKISDALSSAPSEDPMFELVASARNRFTTHPAAAWIDELNLETFSSDTEANRAFNLSRGTALGISLGHRVHETKDAYICENPLRNQISAKLKEYAYGRDVVWDESAGIVEMGAGLAGTIPIASFSGVTLSGYFGFFAGTLLRYRSLEPSLTNWRQKPSHIQPKPGFHLPFSATEALKMSIGSEIEMIGQGRLYVDGGIYLMGGPSAGPYTAGIAGTLTANAFAADEYGITVSALDGCGKVRVALRRVSKKEAGISASIVAGIISPGWTGAPLVGDGLLAFMVGNDSMSRFQNAATNYSSLSLGLSQSYIKKDTEIASYDLDLHNSDAQEAYSQLLRLAPGLAENLSLQTGSGVQKARLTEHETESRAALDITLFGDKLFLAETLENEKRGELIRADGSHMIYRDSLFKKTLGNFVTGNKHVEWEAVSIKESNSDSLKPFYRLRFEQNDFDFGANKLKCFLQFANALGISISDLLEDKSVRFKKYERLLSKSSEVQTAADIYFTEEGIDKLALADAGEGAHAFLLSSVELRPRYRDFPFMREDAYVEKCLKLIEEFRELRKWPQRLEFPPSKRLLEVRKEYFELTKRKIAVDARLIGQAKAFGDAVEKLKNPNDPEQIAHFFTSLGKSTGFDFKQTIVALSIITGAKNMLVHRLSVSGPQVILESDDEGSIAHPREIALKDLNRAI